MEEGRKQREGERIRGEGNINALYCQPGILS